MGRDRWLWVGCCAALACTPLQEGGADRDDGGSSGASETSASSLPTSATSTTTTATSADDDSGSTQGPPQTTEALDDTGDTSETGDGGSTIGLETTGASDETGPPANVHDGVYTGTMSTAISVFDVGVFPCDGTATFTVTEAGAPQITGMGSCSVSIPEWKTVAEVTSTADGSLAGAAASGNVTLGIVLVGVADNATWSGAFAGDTFDGTFSGATLILGIPTTYNGTWTTTR